MPRPAALRTIAPRLVGLFTVSSTATRYDVASTSAADGNGLRAKAASAPRWTWNPVTCSSTSSAATIDRSLARVQRQLLVPVRAHQHRPHPVARPQGPSDHQLALGDEDAVLRLDRHPQRDIGEVLVVRQQRVSRVGDLVHASHHAWTVRPARGTDGVGQGLVRLYPRARPEDAPLGAAQHHSPEPHHRLTTRRDHVGRQVVGRQCRSRRTVLPTVPARADQPARQRPTTPRTSQSVRRRAGRHRPTASAHTPA